MISAWNCFCVFFIRFIVLQAYYDLIFHCFRCLNRFIFEYSVIILYIICLKSVCTSLFTTNNNDSNIWSLSTYRPQVLDSILLPHLVYLYMCVLDGTMKISLYLISMKINIYTRFINYNSITGNNICYWK